MKEEELEKLKEEQKRKVDAKEHKLKPLEEYFCLNEGHMDRSFEIMNALENGYSQASVSRHLSTSTSLISKIMKEMQ